MRRNLVAKNGYVTIENRDIVFHTPADRWIMELIGDKPRIRLKKEIRCEYMWVHANEGSSFIQFVLNFKENDKPSKFRIGIYGHSVVVTDDVSGKLVKCYYKQLLPNAEISAGVKVTLEDMWDLLDQIKIPSAPPVKVLDRFIHDKENHKLMFTGKVINDLLEVFGFKNVKPCVDSLVVPIIDKKLVMSFDLDNYNILDDENMGVNGYGRAFVSDIIFGFKNMADEITTKVNLYQIADYQFSESATKLINQLVEVYQYYNPEEDPMNTQNNQPEITISFNDLESISGLNALLGNFNPITEVNVEFPIEKLYGNDYNLEGYRFRVPSNFKDADGETLFQEVLVFEDVIFIKNMYGHTTKTINIGEKYPVITNEDRIVVYLLHVLDGEIETEKKHDEETDGCLMRALKEMDELLSDEESIDIKEKIDAFLNLPPYIHEVLKPLFKMEKHVKDKHKPKYHIRMAKLVHAIVKLNESIEQ